MPLSETGSDILTLVTVGDTTEVKTAHRPFHTFFRDIDRPREKYYSVAATVFALGFEGMGSLGPYSFVKSGVILMGFNSLYVHTISTCGTLKRPMDATLLKKWGPFTLGCVKRHENAAQHEHCCYLTLAKNKSCKLKQDNLPKYPPNLGF